MNKSIIGAWATSLGVAFYAGYSAKQPAVNVTTNNIDQVTSNSFSTGSASTDKNKSITDKESIKNRVRVSSTKKVRTSVNVVMADLKALLGNGMMGMDMAAYAESYNLVKDLTEEELAEALDLLHADIKNPANIMPLMLLLGAYAEYNPMNAIAFYENNITSPQTKMTALSGILSTWSKNNPDEAYEWFLKQNDEGTSSGMMGSNRYGIVYIFQGLAKKDIGSAVEKLKKLNPVGFEAQMAASGIASSLKEKEEFIDFFEETQELDNQKIKSSILQNWVSRSPEEVTAWLDTQEESDDLKKYNQQVLSGWMNRNPQDAAAWFMEKAEDKQKAADRVIQQWTWRDPEAAMDWVQNQKGVDAQKSTQKILENSIYQNPDFAIKNIDKLESAESKRKLSVRIYGQLKNQSKSKADEFLAASPFKDQINKIHNQKKIKNKYPARQLSCRVG